MKKILALLAIVGLTFGVAMAQEEEETPVTDEELKGYAVVMDSVDAMKENVKNVMAEMIKGNEELSTARYNELNDAVAKENDEKLAEMEATEEEIAFIKNVIAIKDSLTSQLTESFKEMVKSDLGVKTYNKVKAAIKDKEVKARYKEILAEVSAARKGEDGEMTEGEDVAEEEVGTSGSN